MSRVRWIERALRFYPRSWRERYAHEVIDLANELAERRGLSQRRIALGLMLRSPQVWGRRSRKVVSPQVLSALVAAIVSAGVCLGVLLFPATAAQSSPTTVPFRITSGAMEPTLKPNETVQVMPFKANTHIVIGEIVVIRTSADNQCAGSTSRFIVKRVVALPAQTISLSRGNVDIDGSKLAEHWLPSSERGVTFPGPSGTSYNLAKPYSLPAHRYYVLGDNRTDSCDSRYWGPVPRSLLYGEVVTNP
jgi:signal peptidase I